MSNIFYLVDNPLRLCVLKPAGEDTGFHTYEIDVGSLTRLSLEAAPYIHKAVAGTHIPLRERPEQKAQGQHPSV